MSASLVLSVACVSPSIMTDRGVLGFKVSCVEPKVVSGVDA